MSTAAATGANSVLYGSSCLEVADTVVLSPVPALCRALVSARDLLFETRGWWRLWTVAAGCRQLTIIQHPESARVVDAVLSVAGLARTIYLFGLCGSIDGRLPIGSLVLATSASRAGADEITARWPRRMVEAGDVVLSPVSTVDGFLREDHELLERHRQAGIGFVDLEAHYFYSAAEGHFDTFTALLAVSDQPPGRPFWDSPLTEADLQSIGGRMRSVLLRLDQEERGPG